MQHHLQESFDVSEFRPEDAEGIVRLFRAVYGDGYPIRIFYDPAAIVAGNRDRRYHSIVARRDAGDVIGVTHIYRSAPCTALYEWGAGLVLKEYRSSGVNSRLGEFLHNEFVPGMPDIEELFGEPVCNHTHMQKVVILFGYVETAIELALMPAKAYDNEKSAPGRVATLVGFCCCQPKPHRIYLPAPYERELRVIYARLGDGREIAVSDADVPGNLMTKAELSVFDFAQVARISLTEIGSDFVERFSGLEKEAISRNVVVLQAGLNLTRPYVGEAVEALRGMGYFFGGALPRWFDGDGILMQKLLCPLGFESIRLLSDFSKQLLEVIRRDWQRAGA